MTIPICYTFKVMFVASNWCGSFFIYTHNFFNNTFTCLLCSLPSHTLFYISFCPCITHFMCSLVCTAVNYVALSFNFIRRFVIPFNYCSFCYIHYFVEYLHHSPHGVWHACFVIFIINFIINYCQQHIHTHGAHGALPHFSILYTVLRSSISV